MAGRSTAVRSVATICVVPSSIEIELPDAGATERLGVAIGERLARGQALALRGELGAGKTCLARGVARGLAVDDPDEVHSPTYLLVVEHPGPLPMLHVDAYLPEKTRRFLQDGGIDYLAERGGVAVVEWADRIADLLPPQTLWIDLRPALAGRCATITDPSRAFPWIGGLAAAIGGFGPGETRTLP